MSSAANAARQAPSRLLAGLELLFALVGIPTVLVAAGGRPRVPHPASLGQVRHLVTGPSGPFANAVLHNLGWAAWALWLYLIVVFTISLTARMTTAAGLTGPGKRLVRIRNRVVPAALAAILDGVFTIAVAVGPARAATSVRALPPPAVALVQRAPAASGGAAGDPGGTYVVQRDDTLSGIAERAYGAPGEWRAIAAANSAQVTNPNVIYPGEVLAVPAATNSPAASSVAPTTYTVQHGGESLWSIAEQFYGDGARCMDIFNLNQGTVVGPHGERLERPRSIQVGWTLRMPAATASPATAMPAAPAPAAPLPVIPPESPSPSPEPFSSPAISAASSPSTTPEIIATVPAEVTSTGVSTPDLQSSPRPSATRPTPRASVAATTSPTPGTVAAGGISTGGPSAHPHRPADPQAPGGHPWHIRLPGGAVIPWSFGALLLGLVAVARARRARDVRLAGRLTHLRLAAEGPQLRAIRRAGVQPSFDTLGPLAHQVLEAWTDGAAFPRVVGAWEQGGEVAFLLEVSPDVELPAPVEADGVAVRFERELLRTWAVASVADVPRLRRGIWAAADGLLVPVGGDEYGALHLPLLGVPWCVGGPGAGALVEAMLLEAGARSRPEDLTIVLVGDVEPFRSSGWPSGDWDLAPLERVAGRDQLDSLRARVEALIVGNAALVEGYGLQDLAEHVLAHPDDRPAEMILVLGESVAKQWEPLLVAGRRLGLGAIVMGEGLEGTRQLLISDDGTLAVGGPDVDRVEGLVPCLLTDDMADEVCEVVLPDPSGELVAEAEEDEAPPVAMSTSPPLGAAVQVQLFGELRVLDVAGDEVPQYGARRATREVLAYLALHPGYLSRDELIQAVWEDDSFRDTSAELHTAISEARHWLLDAAQAQAGAKVTRGSGLQFISHKSGHGYRLVTERVRVDVHTFEAALAMASAEPENEAALQAAVDAYGGDLLARSGEAFTWVETEGLRFDLQKQVGWIAVHLAEVLRNDFRPDDALAMLAPLLDTIVNDDLWLQAMLCEGEPPPRGHGAREAVMELYRRHQRKLRQLNLEPSERTDEVYQALLADSRQRLAAVPGPGGNMRKERDGNHASGPDLRVLR